VSEETTLTRGKLLKRAGVGAAAVWSIPFLTSTASADVGIEAVTGCHANSQVQCPDCGFCSFPCGSKNGLSCGCAPAAKNGKGTGCCACVGNFPCSDSPLCNTNRDCPRGWKCIFNCCQAAPSCAPPCGQGLSCAAATALGRTGGIG
jgi:hypothetical protein